VSWSLELKQYVNLPLSWYEATVTRGPSRAITGDISVDVCVVGGGLAGLTTALELQRAGQQVVLLEASRIASGASGRNGGFVSNGFALGIGDVAKHVGIEAARELYRLSRLGRDYVRNTIEEHEPDIIMGNGMRVCVRYNDRGGLHGYAEMLRRDFGEQVTFEDIDHTRAALATPRYFDSIRFAEAFHIHPLRYALLLARLCEQQGVRIFENSRAMTVAKSGSGFVVTLPQGSVTAKHVVHCVSSLDRTLHRPTGHAVLPVATYIAVTEPLQQDSIMTREAVADTRRAGDYYRLIDEGRILWGGRITTRVSEPMRLAQLMKQDMLSTFPRLGDPRIDYAWPGLMGYALHKMPLIGRDPEGQWFATAFGGHGLNTTAMAGVLIARAIADQDDVFRRFTPFAPKWAFGQLGRLGVQASYWKMQARDRLDEAMRTAIVR
jgi:gamma-glutamylputrescine oxidase